ncbi:hypothetical protein SDC9_200299 [bioreactor metagenome]|uniref:Uncharacterized protein n=1 Tax=bioreactor metagenome TaxID=1076179 RepID=A0A645IN01_9ZZZZ
MNWRVAQTACGNFAQVSNVRRNTTAGSAKRKCRAHNNRIADFLGKIQRIVHIGHNLGRNAGLANRLHGVFKQLAVLRLINRFRLGTEQLDVVTVQKTVFGKLHRKRQAGLSAQRGKNAVRLFYLNNALDGLKGERLNINAIRHPLVGHDGGRV